MLRCLALLSLLAFACGDDGRIATDAPTVDASLSDGAPTDARMVDAQPRDFGFDACETTTATAEPLPATLLFQVDTSGSMNCRADDPSCLSGDPTADPDDSRYDVFRQVLVEALAGLPDSTRVGLMHFPVTFSCAQNTTDVAIDELGTNRASVGTALSSITPEGITPTHDAVSFALGRLRARTDDDDRFLVLATDGASTVCLGCDAACSFDELDDDNDDMVAAIAAAAAESIPTFVIGVPGSQSFRGILSRMASAAGTGRAGCSDAGPTYCHYDLTDPTLDFGVALRDTLAAIGDSVLSCEYPIPPNPDGTFDATKVNVRLTDDDGMEMSIPRDPSRADGWDYTDDMDAIILHGPACDAAQSLESGRVDVLFGCPTILI